MSSPIVRLLAAGAITVLVGGCSAGGGRASRASSASTATGTAPASGTRTGAARTAGVERVAGARAQTAALERLTALGRPIYCAGHHGNAVALTFDDGPGPYTRLALAKLRRHGARATFFLVGKELPRGPSMPRHERSLGAVGDHTWTHPFLPGLTAASVREELARTQTVVARGSGSAVKLFRPPYGARTPAIDAQVKALGMLQIIWNVDSRDSEGANYAGIAANVTSGLHPGSIILMHENRGQTIRALLAIFAALAQRHLRAVSVPELLASDPPSSSQVLAGRRGCKLYGSGGGGG